MAPKFGICGLMTDLGLQPADLARRVEDLGFESLWFGEHAHAPTPERSPARDPAGMDQLYDPYLCLAVAAASTRSLRLGLSLSLAGLHHPIHLAKTLATLDRISDGRLQFGVGGGRRALEIEDFGVAFEDRWKVTCEHLQAIRAIWTQDVAEFEGAFVRFGPMRCWPKPVQPGGPPVLEGSYSRFTPKRIAQYANGWLAVDNLPPEDLAGLFAMIGREMRQAGRDMSELENTIIMRIAVGENARARIEARAAAGFHRIVFLMRRGTRDEQAAQLHWFAQVKDLCS